MILPITQSGGMWEVLRLLALQRGLTAIAKSKPKTEKTTNVRLPERQTLRVPRQSRGFTMIKLLRNELLDWTTIVPATAYHRRSYTRDTVGLSALKQRRALWQTERTSNVMFRPEPRLEGREGQCCK